MPTNMTPEQLRMLTDFMAAAGSAIGGRGSVGEQLGSAVQNINKEQAAIRAQKDAETRAQERGAAGGKALAQALGLLGTKGKDPQGSLGVLKSDAGPAPTAGQLGPLKESGSVAAEVFGLTPDGEPGPTSLSMDKKGNTIIKGLFTPEMFGPGSSLTANDVLQAYYAKRAMGTEDLQKEALGLQVAAARNALPTADEQTLRELEAKTGINMNQPVKFEVSPGNEIEVPFSTIVQMAVADAGTPANVKAALFASGGELTDARSLVRESMLQNPYVNPYDRSFQSTAGSQQAQRMADLNSAAYFTDMQETLKKDDAYMMHSMRAESPRAAPEVRAESRRFAKKMENEYILRDVTGLYPSTQGYSITAHPDKSGTVWFVVKDQSGRVIDKYITRSTVEDYK